jgi:hypothetical protein
VERCRGGGAEVLVQRRKCRGGGHAEEQRPRGATEVVKMWCRAGTYRGVQRWCRAGAEVPLLVFRCRDGGALQILRCFAAELVLRFSRGGDCTGAVESVQR